MKKLITPFYLCREIAVGFLTNCNNGCKFNRGTTEAKLNLETNYAVCSYCDEKLENVTDFAKITMKSLGYILRSNQRRSFVFDCLSCKNKVSCEFKGNKLIGANCEEKDCDFNITEEMKSVIVNYREVKDDEWGRVAGVQREKGKTAKQQQV